MPLGPWEGFPPADHGAVPEGLESPRPVGPRVPRTQALPVHAQEAMGMGRPLVRGGSWRRAR